MRRELHVRFCEGGEVQSLSATRRNIHVSSRRAGQRVLRSIAGFVQRRLKLKVNLEKSAVAHPWERKFLGYSMTHHFKPRLKVAGLSVKRFREKLKAAFHRGRGRKLERFMSRSLTRSYAAGEITSSWRKSRGRSKNW